MAVARPSARRAELLEAAYVYVLEHGLTDLSLRPLAAAVGSSPRVLLYLFGSRDGLIRAVLARARSAELAALADLRGPADSTTRLTAVGARVWDWLADPRHRRLLVLWLEAYSRSLREPDGPWAGFAAATVADWSALLADAQPAAVRDTAAGVAARTALLAVLRGAVLDLLATGDTARVTAAVHAQLSTA